MTETIPVTGACHCGAITFSAEIDTSRIIICHCSDCQIQASTAFRIAALVHKASFVLQGKTQEYGKIGTTGARRMQVFCPVCATGIYSYTNDNPILSLRLGPVHQRAELTPCMQIWGRSTLPWLAQLADIPCAMQQDALITLLKVAASPTP